MANALIEVWTIYEGQIPIYIYRESRQDNRISITKRGVNIRIASHHYDTSDSWRDWARSWLEERIKENPEIAMRFSSSVYETGYQITTPYRTYTLDITMVQGERCYARLVGDTIHIKLSEWYSDLEKSKAIKSLVSRTIAKDQFEAVSKRIHEINDQCFKLPIKNIRIKNNSTNWGSCSSNGNINISTKTLLAPYDVQDYVFVHELAHRIEMNHSARYWSVVEKVLPNYKKYEKWLKEEGHTCEI